MAMIKGITVTLYEKVQTGVDPLNEPVYTEQAVQVDNVLVAPAGADNDITDSTDLDGGKAVYTLAIPKEDTHNWENVRVDFFGEQWRTYGIPVKGIAENIPLDWNTKVMVERVE